LYIHQKNKQKDGLSILEFVKKLKWLMGSIRQEARSQPPITQTMNNQVDGMGAYS